MMKFSDKAIQAGRALEETIVPHSSFEAAYDSIERAVQIGTGTGIFTGVRIPAPSGCGKSALLTYVEHRFQDLYGSIDHVPVITASLKEDPHVSQVQGELLSRFNYAIKVGPGRVTNNDVNMVLVKAIQRHHVRLIAIDEFQHVFLVHGNKVATVLIDWVKRLMNLTKVPIVLVGTERLDSLDGVDPQLTTRIPTVVRLSNFKLNGEWKGFLEALVRQCHDVDMSPIHTEFAQKLFNASHGSPRITKGLMVHALCISITKDEARLSRETLCEAYQMHFGWADIRENPFATP